MTAVLRPAALAILLAAGCGGDIAGSEPRADSNGGSERAAGSSSIRVSIDGRTHQFGYVANCTISPVTVGIVAYEEKPDFESGYNLGSLRIVGATENGEITARIEVNYSDEGYTYEGPLVREGRHLSWSGQFKVFDRTTLPKPAVEIGAVSGSGRVSC